MSPGISHDTENHRLALPPGYVLEGYCLEEVLGEGGFGITYLGRDVQSGKRVAIKELLPVTVATRVQEGQVVPLSDGVADTFEWALQSFISEARTLADLAHPNVVLIHRLFQANGTAYMVMDYVEGQSMGQWLRTNFQPTEAQLRGILMPLLDGLEHVHAAGLLHRDIKPDNIFITASGKPVLIDFGSARVDVGRTREVSSILTSAGYSAQEMYLDNARHSPATDLYSVAACLVRAITGRHPAVAIARVQEPSLQPPVALSHAGRCSTSFLRAVDAAFAVQAAERPQSVAEWRALLEATEESGASQSTITKLETQTGVDWTSKEMPKPTIVRRNSMVTPPKLPSPRELPFPSPREEAPPMACLPPPSPAFAGAPRRDTRWRAVAALALLAVGFGAGGYLMLSPGDEGRHQGDVVVANAGTSPHASPSPGVPSPMPAPSAPPPAGAPAVPGVAPSVPGVPVSPAPTPAPAAVKPKAGDTKVVELPNGVKMIFCYCPPGTFMMGSLPSEAGHGDDENQVRATISQGYWMAKTEVTQRQWTAVAGSRPSLFAGADLPVESVSWEEATQFLDMLNTTGGAPAGWKYALPTEAQWEHACRADTGTPFSFGDRLTGRQANFGASLAHTREAGAYEANAWGLQDMHGNVAEWCGDWHGPRLAGGTDPVGPAGGVFRVARGGSWFQDAAQCRAASRAALPPDARRNNVGFRPALVPSVR